MPKNLKESNQLVQNTLHNTPEKEPVKTSSQFQEKLMFTSEIDTFIKCESAFKVGFKLIHSTSSFSKMKSDLWFDNQQISSVSIRVPQGARSGGRRVKLSPVLDMKALLRISHHKSKNV